MKSGQVKRNFDWPLFFTGFILSVIFMLFLLGMLLVYSHITETGTVKTAPLFSLETGDKAVTLCLLGEELVLERESYRQLEPLLQKLCVFLPPGPRAFAASWNVLRLWHEGVPLLPQGPPPGVSGG